MKIQFKGLIKNVGIAETFKNTRVRELLINKPAFTDEFGQKKGKDNILPVKVFNEKIESLPELKYGDKVEVTAWLNSKEQVTDNGFVYYTYLSLLEIKKV